MTPNELTEMLYQSGALQRGSVTEIQTTENEKMPILRISWCHEQVKLE